jgi:3-deoxy-manno-octulosonate cytidylyltransferase (CMP-KDO synthetase)
LTTASPGTRSFTRRHKGFTVPANVCDRSHLNAEFKQKQLVQTPDHLQGLIQARTISAVDFCRVNFELIYVRAQANLGVMRNIAIIPARYQSLRFPGKLMTMLQSEPLIAHTVRRVRQARLVDTVVVATDDDRIADAVRDHCDVVLRTPSDISFDSGTQRVAWATRELLTHDERSKAFVVNVQGDQPGVNPTTVDSVLKLAHASSFDAEVSTLCTRIRSAEEYKDSAIVKCILDNRSNAMYFSRCAIPFLRDRIYASAMQQVFEEGKGGDVNNRATILSCYVPLRHLGLYAFDASVLVDKLMRMESCALEEDEKLEQLRWLYNGARIRVGIVDNASHSVDKPSDVCRAEEEVKHR